MGVASSDCRVVACVVVSVFVVVAAELFFTIVSPPRSNFVHGRVVGARAMWPMYGCAQAGLRGRGDV